MRQKAAFLALAILGAGALLGACRPAEPVIVTQEVRVVETEQGQVNVPGEFVMGAARLAAGRGRARLICGVNPSVPGFGFVDANGQNVGFDPDVCRARIRRDLTVVSRTPALAAICMSYTVSPIMIASSAATPVRSRMSSSIFGCGLG